jgi:hypothetical protein
MPKTPDPAETKKQIEAVAGRLRTVDNTPRACPTWRVQGIQPFTRPRRRLWPVVPDGCVLAGEEEPK